jgi:hypothetical protein
MSMNGVKKYEQQIASVGERKRIIIKDEARCTY